MKKQIAAVFSVFLALCLLASVGVYAEETPAAELTDSTDVVASAGDDSFMIVNDGEVVLEVVHVREPGLTAALSDVTANGYYTAEFMIPETNDKVYLTGLTQDNVSEIKQAIIDNYTEGGDFDLKNLGFIDAEKTWEDDGDDNLCWAASSANVLTYTGWAALAGFDSTDDLFEAFIDAFEDNGGNVFYGAGWFFNGISGPEGASQPTAGTGAYLNQYSYYDMVDVLPLSEDAAVNYSTLYDRLLDGCGVSLSVDIYGENGYESCHAVTCWGFVTDIRYPAYNKLHYKSLFVTDSDSDKYDVQNGKDRRDADDVMSLYALEPIEQEYFDGFSFAISPVQTAVITESVTLCPYSAELPYETSTAVTRDLTTTPDICLSPFFLTNDKNVDQTLTTFAPGSDIYYQPNMLNISEVNYVGSLKLVITVTDSNGIVRYSRTFNSAQARTILPSKGLIYAMTKIDAALPVGDYTITASFNPAHNVAEAYYFNNIKSIDFKVRESYLLGDVDGDDDINIVDATVLQRMLVGIDVDIPENEDQRGDVDNSGDPDISDVTLIQRYLSDIDIYYTIGETRFYE